MSWSDGYPTAERTDSDVIADVNATASFAANIYNVSFVSQGGSQVTGITAPYNTLITAPAIPTMTGYTFGGWYKEAACTTAWDFAVDVITADTILYAKWTINSYTVTFQDWDGTVLGAQLIRFGDDAVAPAAPVRSGYTFESWSVSYTDVADNTMVEAVYRINPTTTPTATPTTAPTTAPTAIPTAIPTATPTTAAVLGATKTGETDNQTGMIIGIVLLLAFGAVTAVYVIRRKKIKD